MNQHYCPCPQLPAAANPDPNDITAALSSLKNHIDLSRYTLSEVLSNIGRPPPPPPDEDLVSCPFTPQHRMPPESLFFHFLRCSSSPHPIPNPDHLLRDALSDSNFFYRDCPGVVTVSASRGTTSFTLHDFLSVECDGEILQVPSKEDIVILPSEIWAIKGEVEAWSDYPSHYPYCVLLAVLGIGMLMGCRLKKWILAISPLYGVVIDSAVSAHIFSLFNLCFKAAIREALGLMDILKRKENFERGRPGMTLNLNCPALFQALTWLASQLSCLYGQTNAKFLAINLLKRCVLDAATNLSMYPLHTSKGETGKVDTEATVSRIDIVTSQVAAAIAALHERSLLEEKIKGFQVTQEPTKHQMIAEYGYVSQHANEERNKRPHYRPIIEHDGLPVQQSCNQVAGKVKTREELLAEERDYKRRRTSYRGKKLKQSTLQVMRYIIEEYMEEINQAGGIGCFVKESGEGTTFSSRLPSDCNISSEGGYPREANNGSSAVTVDSPSQYKQETPSGYNYRSKTDGYSSLKDNEQQQGHYQKHKYMDSRRIANNGKYDEDDTLSSPKRHKSHSRSDARSSRASKHICTIERRNEKSRSRDRWQQDKCSKYIGLDKSNGQELH